ncbi:MAG: hypothetical protein ACOYL6_05060 [Bacteriovoracaceae bacterium]
MVFLRNFFSPLFTSLFFLLWLGEVHATVFIPVPLSKQIESADAVVQGEFVQKSSKKIENRIVTDYVFRVQRFASRENPNIFFKNTEKDLIHFFQPGGVVGTEAMSISGTADFKLKENGIVILKKGPKGEYWLASLGLGKYDYVVKNGQELWSSSIFPTHPELGHLREMDWNEVLNKTFHSTWHNVFPEIEVKSIDKNKIVYEHKFKAQRKIASEKSKGPSFAWMVAAMSLLFVLGMWLAKEKQANE